MAAPKEHPRKLRRSADTPRRRRGGLMVICVLLALLRTRRTGRRAPAAPLARRLAQTRSAYSGSGRSATKRRCSPGRCGCNGSPFQHRLRRDTHRRRRCSSERSRSVRRSSKERGRVDGDVPRMRLEHLLGVSLSPPSARVSKGFSPLPFRSNQARVRRFVATGGTERQAHVSVWPFNLPRTDAGFCDSLDTALLRVNCDVVSSPTGWLGELESPLKF